MIYKELIDIAVRAAKKGGEEILRIYNSNDFGVESKADDSPLTQADKNCHLSIMDSLATTNLPILSEEGVAIPYEERKDWELFWLVDPLDGTKEFIKRNGEFTVNVALIKENTPVGGVIYVPITDEMYFASEDFGSYKVSDYSNTQNLSIDDLMVVGNKLPIQSNYENRKHTVVGSRSHMSKETQEYVNEIKRQKPEVEILSKGSSLKLCMIAEGLADSYPRYAPTMEWDTGAGHAIAKLAGFSVTQYNSKNEVEYNKEDLLNPWFLVK